MTILELELPNKGDKRQMVLCTTEVPAATLFLSTLAGKTSRTLARMAAEAHQLAHPKHSIFIYNPNTEEK